MVEKDEERQEGYWPRVADAVLQRALRASGAVQIVGAKWCGKTETAKQQAQSAVYLQDPDEGPSLVALAEVRRRCSWKAPSRTSSTNGRWRRSCGMPSVSRSTRGRARAGSSSPVRLRPRRDRSIPAWDGYPYAYAPHVALRVPRVYGRGLTSGALRWYRRGGRHI